MRTASPEAYARTRKTRVYEAYISHARVSYIQRIAHAHAAGTCNALADDTSQYALHTARL